MPNNYALRKILFHYWKSEKENKLRVDINMYKCVKSVDKAGDGLFSLCALTAQ